MGDEALPVRAGRPGDAPEVVRLAGLMYRSIGAGPDGVGERAWEAWEEAATTSLTDDPQRLAVYVVDHPAGEGLVAAGTGTIAGRLPNPWRPGDSRVGYVQWMSTVPDFRRRGLGRAVLRALLVWYEEEGVGVVELHATPDGAPLYGAEGFSDNQGGRAMRRRVWDLPTGPSGP